METLIQDLGLEVILVETALLLCALVGGAIIWLNTRGKGKSETGSSQQISVDKYNSVLSESRQWQMNYHSQKKKYESLQKECQALRTEYNRIKEQLGDSEIKNGQLKEEIEKYKKEPRQDNSEGMIMYASVPRSAGIQRYFSDLHEARNDDSFFEFRINESQDKATFKPLDFLRIRNYDDAMIAMRTEGAKPNVASTVISIEPGSAHLEGKDWIIDKQAKIKLA